MKKTSTLFLFVFISLVVCAQQAQLAPQYSMYMLNPFGFNPAYAGLDNSLSMTGVYRNQWVDLTGNPETQNVNIHMPVYLLRGGLGLNIDNEVLGAEQNTSATLAYNFWMPVSSNSFLSIGFNGGITQKSLDGSKLRTPDGQYEGPTFTHNDQLLPLTKVTAIAPTIGFGLYFQSPRVEGGLAINNLTNAPFELAGNDLLKVESVRNYFISFASNFEIGSSFTIHPSLFVKSDLIETQIELSALIKYNGNIFGGGSFRGYNSESADAIVLIGGFKLNENITLAYSYDVTISALSAVSRGSHELLLNYNLNKLIGAGVPPKIIYNPRFL